MKFGFGRAFGLSTFLIVFLVLLLNWNRITEMLQHNEHQTLIMYCAAGISKPVKLIAQEYEEKYGIKIQTTYDGSGALLSNIRAASQGDVYLAADRQYMNDARKFDLIQEVIPLANQRVTVTVLKGNPKNIRSLEDLLRSDVRVSVADPDVAAISRAARSMLAETNVMVDAEEGTGKTEKAIWDAIWENKLTSRPTVNYVANDVKAKNADVGIVWDATSSQYPELESIEIPEFQLHPKQIVAAVLTDSKDPARALHFLRYLSARGKGLIHFSKFGYDVVEGDVWAEKPEITVFVGGVNRPAVEQIISDFKLREGIEVSESYNGCGVLVSQMKAGILPDLYFACDRSFMRMVPSLFPTSEDVSSTEMVIITAKGNPHEIHEVTDLAKEGLKIGFCDPDKSALGYLCQRLLKKDKYHLWDRLYNSAKDHPATADILLMEVVVGSLDAAIVYSANTIKQRHNLEVIAIDDPDSSATQPIAVQINSQHKHLASRLMAKIRSAESKSRFVASGFKWLGTPLKK